ncbi:MAG: Sua5 YciO YrdC YwlC family protein [Arcobacteraceae bacterium]|nr:Sua5 YciO YrdC YwlC family protein [Arcobacteraceae bacterium]
MDSSLVYLTQTDTTVGFLSSDDKKLSMIKKRDINKKTLQVVDSFKTLQKNIRVPKKFRKMVRNSKKTTFIYPKKEAFRVVNQELQHHSFLKKFHTLYSTSANITQNNFDEEFATQSADIIVYNKEFKESTPSFIFILSKSKKKQIR